MGLLSKIMGGQPAKKPTDDVLLIHGMMLMAGADGAIEGSEIATVEGFLNTLPEFRDKDDIQALFDQASRLVKKHGGFRESIKALQEIQSPAVKKKLFILAADIAMSSGDIDENEDELLTSMQRMLAIDEAFAQSVVEVLQFKYAT